MGEIEFEIKKHALGDGGFSVTIGLLSSTLNELSSNELPLVMNALKRSYLSEGGSSVGFDYRLDFRLDGRDSFPYALDMVLR